MVKQSLAINKHYLFHNRMSYNIIQLHDDIKHVWNISRDFMTREGGAPRCQKVMRYLPYMLEIEHCTFEQYKIRLVIPFADNWSQKSARNVIPFSSIQGIWNNAFFIQMTWFTEFPVSVPRCCITVYPCNRPGIVHVVSVQPISIGYLTTIICYFEERDF